MLATLLSKTYKKLNNYSSVVYVCGLLMMLNSCSNRSSSGNRSQMTVFQKNYYP